MLRWLAVSVDGDPEGRVHLTGRPANRIVLVRLPTDGHGKAAEPDRFTFLEQAR
ncbi:hypothetical protein [Mesorhizobium neociceri]|uniref:Uncharacterized protein n=1 Tax=Mesorhizobium neociceri TaxID=1307853 RepID=A0A838B9N0_9HYPH|nr:hypothetical protein [Mesorhizobium neociceri]MBA1143316.1 hypothetical protein [Mesorhizobium neociceri]